MGWEAPWAGQGGCESPLPWGFGVSPPLWGCPPPCPGLALAGRAGSGGGVTLEGLFPTQRTSGQPVTPRICSAVPAFSCWGSLEPGSAHTGGVTGGCMLHPSCLGLFGGGSGGGGSCCDHPCAKLFREGGPQPARDLWRGAGNGAELGGEAQPGFSTEPPTPRVPRAALCPLCACLRTCCCSWGGHWAPPHLRGVFAPPQALLLLGGAGTSAPLCGPGGTGPSGWIQVTPCPVIPSPPLPQLFSITGAVLGTGLAPSPPPVAV